MYDNRGEGWGIAAVFFACIGAMWLGMLLGSITGCAAPQRPDVKVIPEHTHEEDRLCPYHTLNPPRSWDQMFCASLGGGYWQCDDTLYYVEDK